MSRYKASNYEDNLTLANKIKIEDLIDKKCENCSLWFDGYCSYYKQPTFKDGLCQNHHLTKILPLT